MKTSKAITLDFDKNKLHQKAFDDYTAFIRVHPQFYQKTPNEIEKMIEENTKKRMNIRKWKESI